MATKTTDNSRNYPRRKVALVIGIGDYEKGIKLPNAVNDAKEMSSALEKMGFFIGKNGPKLNLKYNEMRAALLDFELSIKAEDMVLFYFAGHARQWEDQNYLIPADNVKEEIENGATMKDMLSGPDLKVHAVNAQDFLNAITIRNPFVTIFLLDCCRTYHLRNRGLITRDESEGDNQPEGLKAMSAAGSLIAFACAPGSTAVDGKKGETNGLFTKHLLKHIVIPNEDIRMVLSDVTDGVLKESKSDQVPHVTSILRHRNICLCEEAPVKILELRKESITVSPLRGSSIDIHPNAKWQQNGLTVAGGNGKGDGINELYNPQGLYVDDEQTVYVADRLNHRIVEWKWGATSGQVVAGGNGYGSEAHQLCHPTDVIVDKERDSLIFCDRGKERVVRWSRRNGTSGETIISNIDCVGLTMDENGSLYVTDQGKHEVRRYRRGESKGTVVAGGNGLGNRLDQLSDPQYVFVDRYHSVYVSDERNARVMKWVEGAKEGIVVAGGQGRGHGLKQLSYPKGVVVDQLGTVYVADQGNDRIMRWVKGATQGGAIVGVNGGGGESNELNAPEGLSFDRHGNLYVVEFRNSRVRKFDLDSNA